jgi:hypothetical protein
MKIDLRSITVMLGLLAVLSLIVPFSAMSMTMPIQAFASTEPTENIAIEERGDSNNNAEMRLKSIKEGNARSQQVDGFELTAENALFVQQGRDVQVTEELENGQSFFRAVLFDTRDNDRRVQINQQGVINLRTDVEGKQITRGAWELNVVIREGNQWIVYALILYIGEDNERSREVVTRERDRSSTSTTTINKKIINIDADCGKGTKFNEDTNKCEIIKPPVCKPGQTPQKDKCTPPKPPLTIKCPPPSKLQGDKCVQDGRVLPPCQPNQTTNCTPKPTPPTPTPPTPTPPSPRGLGAPVPVPCPPGKFLSNPSGCLRMPSGIIVPVHGPQLPDITPDDIPQSGPCLTPDGQTGTLSGGTCTPSPTQPTPTPPTPTPPTPGGAGATTAGAGAQPCTLSDGRPGTVSVGAGSAGSACIPTGAGGATTAPTGNAGDSCALPGGATGGTVADLASGKTCLPAGAPRPVSEPTTTTPTPTPPTPATPEPTPTPTEEPRAPASPGETFIPSCTTADGQPGQLSSSPDGLTCEPAPAGVPVETVPAEERPPIAALTPTPTETPEPTPEPTPTETPEPTQPLPTQPVEPPATTAQAQDPGEDVLFGTGDPQTGGQGTTDRPLTPSPIDPGDLPPCEAGQDPEVDNCQRVVPGTDCPATQDWDGQKCVPRDCPPGQVPGNLPGLCVPSEPEPCDDGQVRDENGNCVTDPSAGCPEGQIRDATTGECFTPKPPACATNPSLPECQDPAPTPTPPPLDCEANPNDPRCPREPLTPVEPLGEADRPAGPPTRDICSIQPATPGCPGAEPIPEPPVSKTCDDGSIVAIDEACPEPPDFVTCDDGTVVENEDDCPPDEEELGSSPDETFEFDESAEQSTQDFTGGTGGGDGDPTDPNQGGDSGDSDSDASVSDSEGGEFDESE